jgi:hypothetical protein
MTMATLPIIEGARPFDEIFNDYVPLDSRAKDGRSQNLANPKTGDIAAGFWTGDTPSKNGMWAELRGKGDNSRVQLEFEPTHYRPIPEANRRKGA